MTKIIFKVVHDETDPLLDRVKPLVTDMYRGMKEQGLMLPLADHGADKWIEGIQSTLGRFGVLVVAKDEENIAGFAFGALKFLPDYLGNHRTGVITHLFVKPDYRHHQLGKNLVKVLEEWFAEKKVHSIELQVIAGNDARSFWEKCGYDLELMQYRKFKDRGL